jgi:hypothetical protein
MRPILHCLLLTPLLLFLAPAAALTPHEAVYAASYNGLPITAKKTLARSDDGYRLSLVAKNLLGRIAETEAFHLDDSGTIHPDSYHYERSIFGRGREEIMTVEPGRSEAIYLRKGERHVIEMEDSYLGPLSYQLAMRRDLIENNPELCYQVIYRGRVKEYRFRRLGEEKLKTRAGTFDTIKLERVRDDDQRETLLWVAPSLDYLPVRLWQREEDGESYEMELKASNLIDKNQ